MGWSSVVLAALMAWMPAQAQVSVKYIHTDALGSVVTVTNEQRAVIERREYEPYGKRPATTPSLLS